MKLGKILSLVLIVGVVALLPLVPGAVQAQTSLPTASQVASQMVVGWNLGNTLEAMCSETAWGNPMVTQQLINSVKAAGFNSVRIPVAWDCHSTNSVIDPTWLARVKQVVDYAIGQNMYVIINIHWDGGWLEEHPLFSHQVAVNQKQDAYWTQIANYFKTYNERLLFAGTNEVHADYGTPTPEHITVQESYNQTFVDAVRETGGNNATRTLVVQTYNTNMWHGLNYFTLPTDSVANRLIVEVHHYDPYDYTLNPSGPCLAWGAPYTQYSQCDWAQEAYVDNLFAQVKAEWVNQGIPVIIGEYGVATRPNLNMPSREYYLQYMNQVATTNGIKTFYWDTGVHPSQTNGFALFDRNSGAIVDQGALNAILQGVGGPVPTPTRTNTPSGPTNTPTNTLAPSNTPTRTNTPTGPTATPSGSNLVSNPGFETGAASPWTGYGTFGVVNTDARTGAFSGRVGATSSALEQVISGLTSNTGYTLTGYAKVATAGEDVRIGVKDFGNPEQNVSVTVTGYTLVTINFTTGATSTSAKIYLWKASGGGFAYGDDFQLVASGGGPTNTPTNTLVPSNTPTRTNTPTGPTNTPTNTLVPSNTPTRTNTPTGPTNTPTNTPVPSNTPTNTPIGPTNTPTNTPVPGGNLCATPTVITGGGSYAVPASGVCFKYVNATFVRGAMWSVMNGSSSTVSNVVKWYGGRNETVTNCINDTQTLNGNGAQLNNFTVAKDSNNAMFVTITTNQANTVSMSIQNWQNGSGCSVQPTPQP